MRLLVLVLLSACLAALPLSLAAQSAEDQQRAAQLVDDGMALFSAGSFAEAAIVFQEAYNLDPDAVLMFNIGRAHQEMGDLPTALDVFERLAASSDDPEVRDAAANRLAALRTELIGQGYDPDTVTSEQYVPRGSLLITAVPEDTSVYLDGEFVGVTPLDIPYVDAGSHTLRLVSDGYHPLQATVDVTGGPTTIRRYELQARTTLDEYVPPQPGYLSVVGPRPGLEVLIDGAPFGETPVAAAPMTAGSYTITVRGANFTPYSATITIVGGEESRVFARMELADGARPVGATRRTIGWAMAGTGGAALTAGAVLGALALGSASDYRAASGNPEQRAMRDEAQSLALGTDIAIGLGVALAGAGVTLALTAPREQLDVFSPELVLRPTFGQRHVGLSAGLRF